MNNNHKTTDNSMKTGQQITKGKSDMDRLKTNAVKAIYWDQEQPIKVLKK